MSEELEGRIGNYLALGGLFNPELMDPIKVRDLLIDSRDALRTLRAEVASLTAKLEAAKRLTAPYVQEYALRLEDENKALTSQLGEARGALVQFEAGIEAVRNWLMSVKKLDPEVEGLDATTLLAAKMCDMISAAIIPACPKCHGSRIWLDELGTFNCPDCAPKSQECPEGLIRCDLPPGHKHTITGPSQEKPNE